MMTHDDRLIDWLMHGDPAIRWQVMRDLLHRPKRAWRREQQRTTSDGWGRRLLARQKPDGNWGQGLYMPKWTSTTYTLLLLRSLGLPERLPAALKACRYFLDHSFQETTGGIWNETCITGMALAIFCHFRLRDPRLDRIAEYILREQMPDGGWNCLKPRGATHASFHTTMNVLEGLGEYAASGGALASATVRAEAKGRRFFLDHQLCCSHRTGKVVHPTFLQLSFPARWHHDILRGLEYFRASGAPPDRRLAAAVAILMKKRRKDGAWPVQHKHAGAVFFDMERTGQPSRWNTLRALRVLEWWEGQGPS